MKGKAALFRQGRIQAVYLREQDGVIWGKYVCRACQVNYTVDKPLSWDRCTPEFCHDCTKDLDRVRALFA